MDHIELRSLAYAVQAGNFLEGGKFAGRERGRRIREQETHKKGLGSRDETKLRSQREREVLRPFVGQTDWHGASGWFVYGKAW